MFSLPPFLLLISFYIATSATSHKNHVYQFATNSGIETGYAIAIAPISFDTTENRYSDVMIDSVYNNTGIS